MNNEVEAYVGELRELREKIKRLEATIAKLQTQIPRSEYLQAQIDYDRFDG